MPRLRMGSIHACVLALSLALLSTGFAAEDTLVLPKGFFRARVVGVQTQEIQERYNNEGKLEPFAHALNRSVTVRDLVAQEPRLGQLVNALNALQPGLGNNLMNSNLYTDSRLNQRIVMPALEYGLTQKVTVGIRVPIVTRSSRNSFRADGVNNSLAAAKLIGTLSPQLTDGILSAAGTTLDSEFFTRSLFTNKGYDAPHDFEKTELGDVESGLKYRFYRSEKYAAAVQWGVRLPTGSSPSMTHIFDKGSGSGSYATGLLLLQDVSLTPTLIFGSMAKGTWSLQDTRTRAVPRNPNDALPSLRPEDNQVKRVTRQTGLQFETELALTRHFFDEKFSAWSAYQYAVHGRDRFDGPGNLDYETMGQGTDWWKTNLELGASLYTVPWYRAKKFPLPGRLNLIYSTTLDGKNAPLANFVRTDLIVFF